MTAPVCWRRGGSAAASSGVPLFYGVKGGGGVRPVGVVSLSLSPRNGAAEPRTAESPDPRPSSGAIAERRRGRRWSAKENDMAEPGSSQPPTTPDSADPLIDTTDTLPPARPGPETVSRFFTHYHRRGGSVGPPQPFPTAPSGLSLR